MGAVRPAPDTGVTSLEQTLRLGLAKAGHETLRLRLQGAEITQTRCTSTSMVPLLPDPALIVFLRGRGGACGIAALDAALVASILEARTAGRVSPTPARQRPPTNTDAILSRGFLDAVLTEIGGRLDGHADFEWLCGYHPGDRVAAAERLPYLLADLPYQQITITVDVSAGTRMARLDLIFPQEARSAPRSVLGQAPTAPSDPAAAAAWRAALAARVRESEACLEAVLCHLQMPLAEVEALAVGSVLTMPRAALKSVSLVAPDGSDIRQGHLGQSEGKRAVKLATGQRAPQNAQDDPAGPSTLAAPAEAVPTTTAAGSDTGPDTRSGD